MTNTYRILYPFTGPLYNHLCLQTNGATFDLFLNRTSFANANTTQNNTVINNDNGTQNVQNNQTYLNNVENDADVEIYEGSNSDNTSTPNGSFSTTHDVGPPNEPVFSCISINVGGFKSKECFPEFIANIIKTTILFL